MAALLSLGTAALFVPACATDANDVTGCRQLEFARCARATECGLDLQGLLPTGSSEADQVTACQLFYQDACLHGLVTTAAVTSKQVSNCVAEISADGGDCNYVVNPQSAPECVWLIPPDAGTDAADGDVVTSTADVTVMYVYPDATVSDAPDEATTSCLSECESECVDSPTCLEGCPTMCAGM
jgi:hypothetical protein